MCRFAAIEPIKCLLLENCQAQLGSIFKLEPDIADAEKETTASKRGLLHAVSNEK